VSESDRARILGELDTEFKTKFKALQNEEAKDALKTRADETKKEIESIKQGTVLDEATFHKFSIKYSTLFEARIGAEAIFDLFKNIDLGKLCDELEDRYTKAGAMERAKLDKRLALIRGMLNAGVRPEWLFLTRIPLISKLQT
jgi:DNA-directed RNA polymerase subunit beta'